MTVGRSSFEKLTAIARGANGIDASARRIQAWRRHPDSNRGITDLQSVAGSQECMENQARNGDPAERLSVLLGVLPEELGEVVRAWDGLSPPIRAALLALVRASSSAR